MWKLTLDKVKVTLEGHKGQIFALNLDLTYFQHLYSLEYVVHGSKDLLE